MEKQNKEPLIKQPVLNPSKVYDEGGSYVAADGDQPEQPQDVLTELQKGAAQLQQGIANKSNADIQEGTRKITGLANVASGGDPMRQPRARATNGDAVPGAYQEVIEFLPILKAEYPGVFKRLDMDQAALDMQGWQHANVMENTYQSRAAQMGALKREYEGHLAPTLVDIFYECRPVIMKHTDLQGKLPNLTKLAVGTGQDAAEGRAHNDKVRAEGAASAEHEHGTGSSPASPAPGVTTTVTTPAPVVSPPPVAAPAPAKAARHHKPRTDKG